MPPKGEEIPLSVNAGRGIEKEKPKRYYLEPFFFFLEEGFFVPLAVVLVSADL